jgi:hypothetical protein
MKFTHRPNSWISLDDASSTQLTYALQLNPAPLTVSISGRDPVLGSLQFVLTNPTASAIAVNSVEFILQAGTASNDLTPSTASVATSVSDATNWQIQSPGTITSGPATYTLQPMTGGSASIAAGASLVVEIFGFPTGQNPGNSTIAIKEVAGAIGFANFQVTTFPTGFYFNGLSAAVVSGSQLVPVAQVGAGASIALVWNSSIVDLAAITIYYSNAAQGQQSATPSELGQWTSPALTTDTVFTVVVTVSVAGGSPLTAALSTSVVIQNPALIAASITTPAVNGPLTVSGAMQTGAIIATGVTVNGNLSATGALTAASATLSGGLSADSATLTSSLSIGSTGTFNVDSSATAGGRLTVLNNGMVGINSPSPITTLDVRGNLNVSSDAYLDGMVALCNAPDGSRGTAIIGGTGWGSTTLLSLNNTNASGNGFILNSPNCAFGWWALSVSGPCINTSGTWSQFSDLNLKEGVQPYKDSLAHILKINPIRYRFKNEAGLGAREHIGVAAQDLEQIAPYMVRTSRIKPDSEEEYLTTDNGALTYMLINAVKELKAEIDGLKSELKRLKRK